MLLIGIDEAGYGPTLGPLCHGLAAFRVPDVDEPPDLWEALQPVATRAGVKSAALWVDDSKRVYAGSGGMDRLRRTAEAFASSVSDDPTADAVLPDVLLAAEDVKGLEYDPWGRAAGDAAARSKPDPAIRCALRAKLDERGIEPVVFRAGALDARRYNRRLLALENKADVAWERVGALLVRALQAAHPGETVRAVVDRQGGRKFYAGRLSVLFGVALPDVLAETAERSAYRVQAEGRPIFVEFVEQAERKAFAVALASMAAKLVRELLMERFNAFFRSHDPTLAPTAGYPSDAARFLKDTEELRRRLNIEDEALIRRK